MMSTSVLSGCISRLAKEGLGAGTGAKGVYAEIQPVAPSKESYPLSQYRRFELGDIADDYGRTPGGVLAALPGEFVKALADKKLPNEPAGKALLIRGKILHFELSGLMGQAFGPYEEIIVRTELVDKDTNRVLGTANCIGRTKESVNQGIEKKAEGLAKAFAGWISDYYPKREE